MLTSWHFGAAEDILGQKHAFLTKKCEKPEFLNIGYLSTLFVC